MRHAKIRQCVVVHRHPAAQPAIGEMLLAQPRQLPRAADPLHRRPQPQRHHQLGRRRRLPRHPLARLHRIVQGAQNRAPGQTPTPPAPGDRAPPSRRLSRHTSPAGAVPAAATAAFPDPAPPAPAAPANPQTVRYCPTQTGSPSDQSSPPRNSTTTTCCNPSILQKCAKHSQALRRRAAPSRRTQDLRAGLTGERGGIAAG